MAGWVCSEMEECQEVFFASTVCNNQVLTTFSGVFLAFLGIQVRAKTSDKCGYFCANVAA